MPFKVPEKYRVKGGINGMMQSDETFGNNGLFIIKTPKISSPLTVIASDGAEWEHVSVSLTHRCPTWEEMCLIKSLFWGLNGATLMPRRANTRHSPATKTLLPASEVVPCTIKACDVEIMST